jgi:hypothetical protein
VAKDPKPENGRTSSGASRGGAGSSRGSGERGGAPAGKGRTRPPVNVVTPQRPWGLIAAAVAVVVFAAAVITYAVVQVNAADADKITAADQISGLKSYDYAEGQQHVTTEVDYTESPPVGGPHDIYWADCTGTVYDVDIRHENAVHGLEHGAVWITYNPDTISDADLSTLKGLVDGRAGMMLSPYPGLSSTISLQSWNHQLFLDSAADERVQQYIDFMLFNAEYTPEDGASCEQPQFVANPLVEGAGSAQLGNSDAPSSGAPASTPAGESGTTAP